QALSTAPDLACGARLRVDRSRAADATHVTVLDKAGRRCAGAIFALRLSRRTSLAGSVFAQLAAQVGLNRARCVILGRCGLYRGGRIDLALHVKRLDV